MTFETIAVGLILVTVAAALASRETVSATCAGGAGHPLDPVDGAIAVAKRRLEQGDITYRDFERIVSVLRD